MNFRKTVLPDPWTPEFSGSPATLARKIFQLQPNGAAWAPAIYGAVTKAILSIGRSA
jgi:hypothetical protein